MVMQEKVIESFIFGGIAFVLSAIFAPILISLLYRLHLTVQHKLMKDKSNESFFKLHSHKSGTPNMGGILIWLVVPLLTLLLVGVNTSTATFSITFFIWGLIGLIDGLLVIIKKSELKFRQLQESFEWRLGKLLLLFIIAVATSSLLLNLPAQGGNLTIEQLGNLTIFGNTVQIPEHLITTVSGLVIILGIYAFELTDGLDGLLAGLTMRSLVAFFVLLIVQGRYELLPIIGISLGVLLVYLYFNIAPARVFMGGSGAMPLGAMLLFIALYTDNLIPYIFMTLLMWVELASSAVQIITIRFFKRKVFRLAPLHHHFEALGWPETKVVMRFWLFHSLLCIIGITIGMA